jgi:hypothetical protein
MLRIYARRPAVREAHERNLEVVGDLDEFQRRALGEIRRRHLRTIRWHTGGDVFSVEYGRALLTIMTATPTVEHFLYTRSWRVPRLVPVLEAMARLPNVSLWFSCDASTGLPRSWPASVRLCWLALEFREEEPWEKEAEQRARCALVFMDAPLRRFRRDDFGGVPVCVQERQPATSCSVCRLCIERPT